MEHVLNTVLTFILAVAFDQLMSAFGKWSRVLRNRRGLTIGKWTSNYEALETLPEGIEKPREGIDVGETPETWVQGTVVFKVPFLGSQISFENKNSFGEVDYKGRGSLVKADQLIGDWESTLPSANADGTFLLTITAHGDIMYGYWVGSVKTKTRRSGGWVLVREKGNLDQANQLLQDMSNHERGGRATVRPARSSRARKAESHRENADMTGGTGSKG